MCHSPTHQNHIFQWLTFFLGFKATWQNLLLDILQCLMTFFPSSSIPGHLLGVTVFPSHFSWSSRKGFHFIKLFLHFCAQKFNSRSILINWLKVTYLYKLSIVFKLLEALFLKWILLNSPLQHLIKCKVKSTLQNILSVPAIPTT